MISISKTQTPFVLDTSILPPPGPRSTFPNSSTPLQIHPHFITISTRLPMAPQKSEIKKIVKSTESKVHSLKAAIFHTMAYKMSLEINKGDITLPTRRSFLKVLYNVCQIRKKDINFEQYYRLHVHGPKIAICETTSDSVFVLNSSFTHKDHYFNAAVQEALDAFNAVMKDFGYSQQLELYDANTHQVHSLVQHPFWTNK